MQDVSCQFSFQKKLISTGTETCCSLSWLVFFVDSDVMMKHIVSNFPFESHHTFNSANSYSDQVAKSKPNVLSSVFLHIILMWKYISDSLFQFSHYYFQRTNWILHDSFERIFPKINFASRKHSNLILSFFFVSVDSYLGKLCAVGTLSTRGRTNRFVRFDWKMLFIVAIVAFCEL